MRFRWTRLVSLVGLLYFAGCSSLCAESASNGVRQSEADQYVFTQPAAQTWAMLRPLVLEDKGVTLPETPPPPDVEQTYPIENSSENLRQLVVQFTTVPPGYRVLLSERIQRQENGVWTSPYNMPLGRLTYRVVERVDPARAAQIERAAQEAGDQAQADCRRCQREFIAPSSQNR